MRVLFLCPLPPPITGHSIAAQTVRDGLTARHQVTVVDLGKGSQHDGGVTWSRLRAVGAALAEVRRGERGAESVYLTISESLFGNLKDLAIYALCAPRLDRVVVHLHGGSIGRDLFDRRPLIRWLNRLALSRVGAVILSGKSHLPIIEGMTPRNRVHLVPNFADDALFSDRAAIESTFAVLTPLRVLYMSGMIAMKGYDVLADAYLTLTPEQQSLMEIDFAGKFDSAEAQAQFESRIAGVAGLTYHGLVDHASKSALFAHAHVFCLPTAFREGQPLSILEAYAAGCVVLTTPQPGILDIFTPGKHGWAMEPQSVASARAALEHVLAAREELCGMALANRTEAEARFRTGRFTSAVEEILRSVGAGGDGQRRLSAR